MRMYNETLKLLRETGRDNDPFKDVGTLNCIERNVCPGLDAYRMGLEPHIANPIQIERTEVL